MVGFGELGGVMSYLDLKPEAVADSGRRTAATSQDWACWAGRSQAGLRDGAAGALDPVMRGALEEYLSAWNRKIQGLAVSAEALGTNAVSAANTMVGADQQSAAALNQAATEAARVGSLLSRPINF